MKIEIKSCQECNELEKSRDYTADSFEMLSKWDCRLAKKNIARYVDWNDKDPKIPGWCPKKA